MKRYISSKSSDIVIHFCLLVLFALLPFVFSDALLETETTFRFIVSGITLSLFLLFFIVRPFSGAGSHSPQLHSNPFYKILFALLLFWGISMIKTINKGEAIYDYLKICTIVSYFFFFLYLLRNKKTGLSVILKYIHVSVFSFTLIALSQVGLQLRSHHHFKLDFLFSSSLGNKNFYAETMALFLPLIIMGIITLRRFWRLVAVCSLLITLATLIILQTLSTWVAFVFCILFLSAMQFYLHRKKLLSSAFLLPRRGIAIATGGIVIVLFCIAALYQVNHLNLIKKRLSKISEYAHSDQGYKREDLYHTNSVAERIFLWQNAWRMFKDYPVTGAGMDNWKIYATKYELPFSKYSMDNSTRYMRPHNDLLLILAENGIIGFVLFTGLFAVAFLICFRLLRTAISDSSKVVLLLALSGLIIYLCIACFSLPGDRFYTQVLLFLFFAIICAEYDLSIPHSSTSANRNLMAAICIILFSSGISVAYIGVKRYSSEIHLIYALQAQSKKDWQKMSYHAVLAKSFFFPIDYTATPIAWYQGMAAFNSQSPTISRYYFEEALRCNPYDLLVLNDLATAIQREGDNDNAMKVYNKALAMAPYFTSAYMNKVVMIYNQGDRDKAYQYLRLYPAHQENPYKSLMTSILTDKVKNAISDTLISRKYLKGRYNLLLLDSAAAADHTTFEQLVLSDPGIKNK